ncbi:MAG: AAA family ATPase [Bryobacterales bacterium]|nr:AAA family ATPase [Bryobacterales bacterium]MDE0629753.1 AAA family ATPase [Bryobacterales bacterium]
MAKRLLPIGIQTFRKLRKRNYYYVDKTPYAMQLIGEGTHYFLSRPRRFGKSLFLDTLKALFEGRRELFQGLHAHGDWEWSVRHPVVRLDFSGGDFEERGYLRTNLMAQLDAIEEEAGIRTRYDTGPERLADLIRGLHRQSGRGVAVLVDEYDKPILDALDVPEIARANRNYLRGLYAVLKSCDAQIRFCMLTGVSRFSKVSLFSGLNNLIDITLEPAYSSICGYTESDLDDVFAAELEGLDRDRVRDWYNGYSWGGVEKVYNPFDALLLFRKRTFSAWWFETATPTFLVETLVKRGIATASLDGRLASEKLLGTFDVGRIATEALLFQTGYLTIQGQEDRLGKHYYRLGYPNREVRESLNESLVDYLTGDDPERETNAMRLGDLLLKADFAGLERLFRAMYAGIPYEWHIRNEIARFEGYYASVFYSYFAGLGLEVRVEESGSAGRLDMAVRAGGRVFLFEFKVLERSGPGAAMAQLKERGYADKYRHLGEPVHLVAVEFSAKTRNIAGFETAQA